MGVGVESEFSDRLWLVPSLDQAEQWLPEIQENLQKQLFSFIFKVHNFILYPLMRLQFCTNLNFYNSLKLVVNSQNYPEQIIHPWKLKLSNFIPQLRIAKLFLEILIILQEESWFYTFFALLLYILLVRLSIRHLLLLSHWQSMHLQAPFIGRFEYLGKTVLAQSL